MVTKQQQRAGLCSSQTEFNYSLFCSSSYYIDAVSCSEQGIMLVYDITNERSFENIKNWIRNIEEV